MYCILKELKPASPLQSIDGVLMFFSKPLNSQAEWPINSVTCSQCKARLTRSIVNLAQSQDHHTVSIHVMCLQYVHHDAAHRAGLSAAAAADPCLVWLLCLLSSKDLVFIVAEAIGTEARAVFNNASRSGDFTPMKGISCFAPFINIMRHPLWGRVQVCIAIIN